MQHLFDSFRSTSCISALFCDPDALVDFPHSPLPSHEVLACMHGDHPISAHHHMMSFLSTVLTSTPAVTSTDPAASARPTTVLCRPNAVHIDLAACSASPLLTVSILHSVHAAPQLSPIRTLSATTCRTHSLSSPTFFTYCNYIECTKLLQATEHCPQPRPLFLILRLAQHHPNPLPASSPPPYHPFSRPQTLPSPPRPPRTPRLRRITISGAFRGIKNRPFCARPRATSLQGSTWSSVTCRVAQENIVKNTQKYSSHPAETPQGQGPGPKGRKKNFGTQDSHVVPHHGTN